MINKVKKSNLRYRIYVNGDKNDCSTQTAKNLSCFLCFYKWDSVYDLYSHLLIHCHRNKNFITCLRCKFKLNSFSLETHDCLKNNSTFIEHKSLHSLKYGLPIICLLCDGRRFNTKTLLFVHLICYHNPKNVKINECGKCNYKIKKNKLNKKIELFKLPNYNIDFDKHIEENHVYGYELAFIQSLNLDSEKREPYACVACSTVLNSNDRYEAHIICRHSTDNEYDRDTFVCIICDVPYWNENKFNEHVNNVHTSEYRKLANKLSKDGTLTNYVDLDTICIYCWNYFECTLKLHSHLIMQHSYFTTSIQCGLCSLDFRVNKQLKETYNNFVKHNEAHFKDIETGKCSQINIFSEPIMHKEIINMSNVKSVKKSKIRKKLMTYSTSDKDS